VRIRSEKGGRVRLAWAGKARVRSSGVAVIADVADGVVSFETRAGDTYTIGG
jgi:hypothetical protein